VGAPRAPGRHEKKYILDPLCFHWFVRGKLKNMKPHDHEDKAGYE
jgi:hypothetical protein